ncbi:MAG: flagellar assembly peptidoglycan hydrolase FlgJ [Burkholderiales bacterium]
MDLRATAQYSGGLAQDAGALAALKGQAKNNPQQALKTAAREFEALFLQQLMKSMRAALPDDGPTDSDATKTYTEMLDAQLAQTLAKKGTGIADMLVMQLSRTVGAKSATEAATTPSPSALPLSPARKPMSLTPGGVPLPATTPPVLPKTSQAQPATSAAATAAGVLSNAAAAVGNAASDFVAAMKPYAEKAAEALGIPVHYIVAQAGLETGWGKHQPRVANGAPSNNLFGIKAGPEWKGAVAETETTEYVGGKAVKVVQRFRAYASPQEAFADFAQVLAGSGRYSAALTAKSADGYAAHMQRAGYATDPAYGAKLARTIKAVARRDALSQTWAAAQERAPAADTGSKSV